MPNENNATRNALAKEPESYIRVMSFGTEGIVEHSDQCCTKIKIYCIVL